MAVAGPATHAAAPTVTRSCAAPSHPGELACLALKRTDLHGLAASGFGPSDLTSAYRLPAGGSGQTVAIVDAMDDPNAESDLAAYRSNYGLPACTTANGCFKKIDQNGGSNYPTADTGWAGEISLDVDMVSAVCPSCHILLVEAASANQDDLGTAVNQAVAQGAKFVSNSYGGSEDSTVTSADAAYFNHPGVAITVSAGDSNTGAEYPATSQYVTAVGGTALRRDSSARGWSETVWKTSSSEGTGSGCSAYVAKPSWQKDTGCSRRAEADVSAVADPATGVAVYQTYGGSGWSVYGGTSAAAPIIAGAWALAGAPAAGDRAAQYPYLHTSAFNDVTSGNNGSCSISYICTAGPGYDGPTGLGTPNGVSGFTAGGAGSETVTVTNPGDQATKGGGAVSLQITGSDSAGKSLTYSATGLPVGLSISSSGLITGTPTGSGSSTVTVTASSGTASGSTSFTWTVGSGGGETVTFRNPGTQSTAAGTAVSLQIAGSDSAGNALTYSATGLPAGLSISSSGLITGTPTTAGSSTVTVTATSGTASGSVTFGWTVTGGGGTGCGNLPAWSAATSYVPNDQVSYNGHKWLSTWYSTGATPGAPASWAVWSDQGAC
ncbi:putative Ig domain-containing protein [Kitasatospora sp. MMS16-BH015]|uniref:putative Ig domain-containing protein n=1 Tax=Kitasatospora sp. MMS16-BH015 TaxID=2018025 RepID=UPI00273865BA|nr:putative Ig domain-containing protein [Kitasatospora sp. MMS16-BH015]